MLSEVWLRNSASGKLEFVLSCDSRITCVVVLKHISYFQNFKDHHKISADLGWIGFGVWTKIHALGPPVHAVGGFLLKYKKVPEDANFHDLWCNVSE